MPLNVDPVPGVELVFKSSYGKTLARINTKKALSNEQTKVIDEEDHTLVTAESDSGQVVTGYVADTALRELDITTVQIPANFHGLEDKVVPTRLKEQLFEIVSVSEQDDFVEVTALHIFYRLRQNATLWEADGDLSYTGAAACRNVLNNSMFDLGFHVASDCQDRISGKDLDYTRMNVVEAFLNPESGLCKRFGLSMIRDNDNFYCLKNVGYDRGFVVESGKNLLGVRRTVNVENTVTRLAPTGRDEDGKIVWLSYNGKRYLDSPHIGDYATPKLGIFDTDLRIGHDGVTAANIQEKLLAEAQKQFQEGEVDLPEITMEISFISLGDTEEYKQYKGLDKVYLYDILSIKDTQRGYSYQAEVVGVDHDILTGRLNGVTIGTLQDWNGIRKVATWQIPEVNGEKIRLKSIRKGTFEWGAIRSSDIATGAVGSQHFGASADGHFKTIFAEELYISNTSEDGLLNTRFTVTEGLIDAEVTRATGAEGTLSGQITVEAGKITQIVQAVGADGQVTAASIVLAINQSTGQSEAKIDADHVYIGNDKSTTVIAGKLEASDITADFLSAKIAQMSLVSVTQLASSGGISFGGGSYNLTSAGLGTFSSVQTGSLTLGGNQAFTNCIVDASVANNTLTLTRASGTTVTFSKATTLSGAWSGATYTVTASPQGNTNSITVEARWSYSTALHRYTVTAYSGAARATDHTGQEAYNQGWNDCIAETRDNHPAGLYTRDTGVYGGSTVHYISSGGTYLNVGSGWYKTAYEGGYYLPDPK